MVATRRYIAVNFLSRCCKFPYAIKKTNKLLEKNDNPMIFLHSENGYRRNGFRFVPFRSTFSYRLQEGLLNEHLFTDNRKVFRRKTALTTDNYIL